MADPTYATRVTAKIAQLEAEITRVQSQADKTVTEIEGQIALLQRAARALTPELEGLLDVLKGQGFL